MSTTILSQPKNIFFSPYHSSTFMHSFLTANMMNKRLKWNTIIMPDYIDGRFAEQVEMCKLANIKPLIIDQEKKHFNLYKKNRQYTYQIKKITKDVQKKLSHKCLNGFMKYLNILYDDILFFHYLLVHYKIDMVVLTIDVVAYKSSMLIRAAKLLNIPSVIMPFTVCFPNSVAENFIVQKSYHYNPLNNDHKLIHDTFPNWIIHHKGKELFRLNNVAHMLAFEELNLTPENPWLYHSGYSDIIAAESIFMKELLVNEGVSSDKIFITGSVDLDIIYDNKRNVLQSKKMLYQELSLPDERPMILWSVVPSQFNFRSISEFSNYYEAIGFIIKALSAFLKKYNIIASIHPRYYPEKFDLIETTGIKISKRDIRELIPLCDIYITSTSATTRWAAALGIPVIDFDIYHYEYKEHKRDGIMQVQNASEFVELLNNITLNQNFYNQLALLQKNNMGYWGQLDGLSSSRILSLFETILSYSISVKKD